MTERIQTIRKMLEKNPDDTFLHYSLGMELASAQQFVEAEEEFKRCIELDENQLAAQVELGKCLRSSGKIDQARQTFAAAMGLAAMQGESHVRDFIQQQLDGLPEQ